MRSRRSTFRAAAVAAAAGAARAGQVPLPGDGATAVASGPIVSAGVPGGCVDDYQVATSNGAPVDVWPFRPMLCSDLTSFAVTSSAPASAGLPMGATPASSAPAAAGPASSPSPSVSPIPSTSPIPSPTHW